MKTKFLFFILISFLLISCHTPSYTFSKVSSSYIKLPEGKYLLNTVDAPEAVRLDMQKLISENFKKKIKNTSLIPLQETSLNLFSVQIPFNPSQQIISQLSENTGNFDYLINVKAEKNSDDIGSIQIGNLSNSDKNIVYVGFEIIDLNDQTSLYFARVKAELSQQNDNKDFAFATDANTMLRKSLKKILRRINKSS